MISMAFAMMLLAQAAHQAPSAPDPMISGNWLITLIGALFSGAALVLGKYWGRTAERQQRTVTISGQPVQFQNTPAAVTVNDLGDLTRRMGVAESEIRGLRDEQSKHYKQLLESGHEREIRIINKMDEEAREWHGRLDAIFGPNTKPARRG